MNQPSKHSEPAIPEDETLARHQKMAEVLEGKRPMDWSDWAMRIHESKCLTSEGQRVALWATKTLQRTLGDDFLQRVPEWLARMQAKDPDLASELHPIFSFSFWPTANDLPWVYANLIRLAARIQLFLPEKKNRHSLVLKTLRKNLEPVNWGSAWLQFEVSALGLRAGWDVLFEPPLGSGRYADIHLRSGSMQLLVEATMMRMSIEERKALAEDRRLSWQLQSLEWQYDVRISGTVSRAALKEADIRARWFQAVGEAAQATAQDNRSRPVPGPAGVSVTVFRPTEATMGEPWGIEGDPVEARIVDRLIALLQGKNAQAEGSSNPVWVRLDESAGLWEFTRFRGMSLGQALAFYTDILQQAFQVFPNLAGAILSPGVLWTGDTPPDALIEQVEYHGAIALRCPVPIYHARETLIIPQAGGSGSDPKVFADWYAQEATWLDWALEQLHHPPFDTLVHEESGL